MMEFPVSGNFAVNYFHYFLSNLLCSAIIVALLCHTCIQGSSSTSVSYRSSGVSTLSPLLSLYSSVLGLRHSILNSLCCTCSHQ